MMDYLIGFFVLDGYYLHLLCLNRQARNKTYGKPLLDSAYLFFVLDLSHCPSFYTVELYFYDLEITSFV